MNQENRTGFFEQYYIACFRPSSYDRLLEGKRRVIPYLLFLVMVLVLIEQVIPMAAWDISVGGLSRLFTERVPEFRVEKGVLTCGKTMEFQVGGTIHVKVDASRPEYTTEDFSDEYVQEILIGKTSMVVKNGMGFQTILFSNLGDSVFDNQSLVSAIPLIRAFMVFYILVSYVEGLIEYMIVALFYLVVGKTIVRGPDGKSVTWKDGLVITIYARTLMSLLTGINNVVGHLMEETFMYMISAGVTLYFMMKAERVVLGVKPKS